MSRRRDPSAGGVANEVDAAELEAGVDDEELEDGLEEGEGEDKASCGTPLIRGWRTPAASSAGWR